VIPVPDRRRLAEDGGHPGVAPLLPEPGVVGGAVPALAPRGRQHRRGQHDGAGLPGHLGDREVAQRIFTQRITFLDGDKLRVFPAAMRYCWPSELDLMAELAGLRRRERYANWRRAPFGPASGGHVTVYEMPAALGPAG
jgi:hypothetical protein